MHYFLKLDLHSGYWQVEVKKDKENIVFIVSNLSFYECNRISFGLTTAPATFQNLMECGIWELSVKECLIFLDDILILMNIFHDEMLFSAS